MTTFVVVPLLVIAGLGLSLVHPLVRLRRSGRSARGRAAGLWRVHLVVAGAAGCAVGLRVVDERLGQAAAIALGVLGAISVFATLGLLTAYRRGRRALAARRRGPAPRPGRVPCRPAPVADPPGGEHDRIADALMARDRLTFALIVDGLGARPRVEAEHPDPGGPHRW